ncbi:hypothetical protein FPZ41_36225 [Streptomyces sp. K1PN6]|uniref:Uncharacterized protein n=1 Tax=Streptomyces acidicola TaxID=2596892 RepID=A0A5N8X2B6_9ACTN|nr:hypothetical protein [Streptomyces acidicola]
MINRSGWGHEATRTAPRALVEKGVLPGVSAKVRDSRFRILCGRSGVGYRGNGSPGTVRMCELKPAGKPREDVRYGFAPDPSTSTGTGRASERRVRSRAASWPGGRP